MDQSRLLVNQLTEEMHRRKIKDMYSDQLTVPVVSSSIREDAHEEENGKGGSNSREARGGGELRHRPKIVVPSNRS
jgi:hypothetical protein